MRYIYKNSFAVLCIIMALCCFSACQKKNIIPQNTNYNPNGGVTNGGGTDTSKADTLATFNQPTGLALDAAGNIYVADYGNNQIRKISTTGIVTTLAGNGIQGSVNAIDSLSSFNGPTGLVVDASGNVFVADNNNNRIREIGTNGMVTTVAGSDSIGLVDGPGTASAFFNPTGLTLDPSGNIYVADAGNNLIRLISSSGNVSTFAGNANAGETNDVLLSSSFNNPTGVAIDAGGNIYVADMLNNAIRKISGGKVSTLAGSDTTASIDGQGNKAAFYFPNSLAIDPSGNLYVTEYATNLIRKVDPSGNVTTFAGSGAQGQADSTGTKATFNGPSGVAVDKAGNVYIADTYNNVIRKITPAGVVSTIAGSGIAGAHNGKAASLRLRKIKALRPVVHVNNNLLYRVLVKRR